MAQQYLNTNLLYVFIKNIIDNFQSLIIIMQIVNIGYTNNETAVVINKNDRRIN